MNDTYIIKTDPTFTEVMTYFGLDKATIEAAMIVGV
jgi:hypothetical protein